MAADYNPPAHWALQPLPLLFGSLGQPIPFSGGMRQEQTGTGWGFQKSHCFADKKGTERDGLWASHPALLPARNTGGKLETGQPRARSRQQSADGRRGWALQSPPGPGDQPASAPWDVGQSPMGPSLDPGPCSQMQSQ